MSIDPRLVERRREVAEDRARRKVGRLVRVLIALGLAGAVAWLLLSPLLSIEEVATTGIAVSSAHSVLVEHGIVAGTPMILIRAGEIETALGSDPWVREAHLELEWPNRVVVRVEERVPTAWVETGGGWAAYAVDGVLLSSAPEPDATMPWIHLGTVAPSETRSSQVVLGSLEFVTGLSAGLRNGARVRVETSGELWAEVAGFQVRLGRAVEMRAKALSLTALILQQPAPGSTLTLIAPTHPAISPP
ncbi:MAG: cell division protein FtsQ/DivIB [Acidimicrobiia bacterium]